MTTEVKKSRFITTVARAPSVEAAQTFIAKIKNEFPDATHNCWAYVIGPPGSTTRNGSSDDGEPGGTAGVPILNALLNSDVGDIVVVVTRYFGGVKLGRGGLVRAYNGGARRALEDLSVAEHVTRVSVEVSIGYARVDAVKRIVAAHEGTIERENFGASAVFVVTLPKDRTAAFEKALTETTNGRASTRRLE